MAQITINIPDNVVSEVLDAFADKYEWTAERGTKANFARMKVAEHIKAIYIEYKDNQSHPVRLQQAEAARLVELGQLLQTVIE